MNEYKSLKNKTALVTGGSKGIGFAIAKKFSEYGLKVAIIGRQEDMLKEACVGLGENCFFYTRDITHLDEVPGIIDNIEKKIGNIEILVNNAGINLKKDAVEITDEEFQNIVMTNQNAVFSFSREVAKKMQQRKSGSILMISSMSAHYGLPRVIAYTASKSAVEGMTRALAVELSPLGIRVNCIAPGFIKSDMTDKAFKSDPSRLERVLSRTPLNRLGVPDDIANAALFLVSDAAKFITGIVLPVDGGNSIGF
jgi:NAD(P)-dependent dehydrogenase (short-subunit alcohol dehydrogenase family)